MSEVRNDNQDNANNENNNQGNEGDSFVPKSAYSKVTADMHKYKSEMKSLQGQLEQYKADQEAREKQALQDQEKWKDLYQKAEAQLSKVKQERDSEKSKFIDFHKKNAVTQAIGGFKKNDYLKFINTDSIEVLEDGSIDQNSIASEVERIKKEYPELIKTSPVQPLPNAAPSKGTAKSVAEMSPEERAAYRREALLKK
jgi:hypothetical protein